MASNEVKSPSTLHTGNCCDVQTLSMPKRWTQKIDTFYSKGIFRHFYRDRFLQHFAVVSSSIWFLLLLVITFSVRSSSRRSANKWIALMTVFESIFGLGTALILVS